MWKILAVVLGATTPYFTGGVWPCFALRSQGIIREGKNSARVSLEVDTSAETVYAYGYAMYRSTEENTR